MGNIWSVDYSRVSAKRMWGAKSLLFPFVPTGLSDNAKKEGFPGCDSNLKLRLARQSDVALWEFFADSYSMQNSGGVWRPQLIEIIYVGEFMSWFQETEKSIEYPNYASNKQCNAVWRPKSWCNLWFLPHARCQIVWPSFYWL